MLNIHIPRLLYYHLWPHCCYIQDQHSPGKNMDYNLHFSNSTWSQLLHLTARPGVAWPVRGPIWRRGAACPVEDDGQLYQLGQLSGWHILQQQPWGRRG